MDSSSLLHWRFIFDVPLALLRKGGKLPSPVISVATSSSHVSASPGIDEKGSMPNENFEIGTVVVRTVMRVVVVDAVIASGETLSAVQEIVGKGRSQEGR